MKYKILSLIISLSCMNAVALPRCFGWLMRITKLKPVETLVVLKVANPEKKPVFQSMAEVSKPEVVVIPPTIKELQNRISVIAKELEGVEKIEKEREENQNTDVYTWDAEDFESAHYGSPWTLQARSLRQKLDYAQEDLDRAEGRIPFRVLEKMKLAEAEAKKTPEQRQAEKDAWLAWNNEALKSAEIRAEKWKVESERIEADKKQNEQKRAKRQIVDLELEISNLQNQLNSNRQERTSFAVDRHDEAEANGLFLGVSSEGLESMRNSAYHLDEQAHNNEQIRIIKKIAVKRIELNRWKLELASNL